MHDLGFIFSFAFLYIANKAKQWSIFHVSFNTFYAISSYLESRLSFGVRIIVSLVLFTLKNVEEPISTLGTHEVCVVVVRGESHLNHHPVISFHELSTGRLKNAIQ